MVSGAVDGHWLLSEVTKGYLLVIGVAGQQFVSKRIHGHCLVSVTIEGH